VLSAAWGERQAAWPALAGGVQRAAGFRGPHSKLSEKLGESRAKKVRDLL